MSANGPDVLDALERAMGHCFRDRALLLQALTHASFANEREDAEDNETLEFLGDSILNFLVTEKLFAAFRSSARARCRRPGRSSSRKSTSPRSRGGSASDRTCASRRTTSGRAAANGTRASRTRSR